MARRRVMVDEERLTRPRGPRSATSLRASSPALADADGRTSRGRSARTCRDNRQALGPENVVLAALRIGQEPALTQRVRQPEDAAAVDPNEVGEMLAAAPGSVDAATASRMARPRSRLWIGRRVVCRFPVHRREAAPVTGYHSTRGPARSALAGDRAAPGQPPIARRARVRATLVAYSAPRRGADRSNRTPASQAHSARLTRRDMAEFHLRTLSAEHGRVQADARRRRRAACGRAPFMRCGCCSSITSARSSTTTR